MVLFFGEYPETCEFVPKYNKLTFTDEKTCNELLDKVFPPPFLIFDTYGNFFGLNFVLYLISKTFIPYYHYTCTTGDKCFLVCTLVTKTVTINNLMEVYVRYIVSCNLVDFISRTCGYVYDVLNCFGLPSYIIFDVFYKDDISIYDKLLDEIESEVYKANSENESYEGDYTTYAKMLEDLSKG